jgi:acyl-coenzyme A synthetase/AMP-(fatty) acid ligase
MIESNTSAFDIHAAVRDNMRGRDDQDAIAFGGRWRSWRWLGNSQRAADLIAAQSGLDISGHAALIVRNRPQHVAALVAQIASRRTTSMVYSMQSPSGIAADVLRLRAPVVVADQDDWTPELGQAVEQLGAMGAILSDQPEGALRLHDDFKVLGPGPFAAPRPDIAFELLSSGTTGAPKRIPLSWAAVTMAVADAQLAYAGTAQRDAPALMVHPLGNIAGLAYVVPPIVYGQRLVLLERFEVQPWAEAVHRYRPVRASIPPAGLRMVLDANIPRSMLASLKLLAVGGGKLDGALHEGFESRYQIPVLTAYGATEFGGVVSNWTPELYEQYGKAKRGSVGRASANVRLRIVDPETSSVVSPGQIGLIEALVPRVGRDWIRTTDLASLDNDGFLFLHGRADAAINRGGFKVAPDEVAEVLKAHPAVADAAVIGLPDARLGEIPAAAVELHHHAAGVTADILKAFARSRLLAYQVPVRIEILSALPRNASMKISFPAVRTLLEERIADALDSSADPSSSKSTN